MNSHLHAGQRALTGLLLSSTLSFCSQDGQFSISPLDDDERILDLTISSLILISILSILNSPKRDLVAGLAGLAGRRAVPFPSAAARSDGAAEGAVGSAARGHLCAPGHVAASLGASLAEPSSAQITSANRASGSAGLCHQRSKIN